MSQSTLSRLLGVSEQAIRHWENGKINIPKPSESLLRLLYREHIHNNEGQISKNLKEIAALEEAINDDGLLFKTTAKGWQQSAA